MRYYAASQAFGFQARLTAFMSARNIIRIRTKWSGREEAAPIEGLLDRRLVHD
jgi:hypothetical protein